MTPIHEPANIPLLVICHDLERKPVGFISYLVVGSGDSGDSGGDDDDDEGG